jgi:hypothetical protein
MGNPSWGKGYHKGFSDGAKHGGTIVGIVLVGAGGLVAAGKWGYRKLKDRKLAKADDIAAEMDAPEVDAAVTPPDSD